MSSKRRKIVRPSPELQAIWDRIPAMQNCKGKCYISCGPIDLNDEERKLLEARAGRKLDLTQPQCPLLTPNGRCSVYSVRPTICRLWGTVKDLKCPLGCQPERWLDRREGWEILGDAIEMGEPQDQRMMRKWARIASEAELDAAGAYVAIGHRHDSERMLRE